MIRWSERLFVLTSFGIIVCSEMNRDSIEFPTLFTYTMMSNIVSNKAQSKLSNFESTLRSAFSLACAFKSSIFQILTICLPFYSLWLFSLPQCTDRAFFIWTRHTITFSLASFTTSISLPSSWGTS